jgi:hypothetical protein
VSLLKVRCIDDQIHHDAKKQKLISSCKEYAKISAVHRGCTYDVLAIECGWFRIIDESGEDYLYPQYMFQLERRQRNHQRTLDE